MVFLGSSQPTRSNTVVHGDEHGGNFFVGEAKSAEGPTVLPIDFFDAVFGREINLNPLEERTVGGSFLVAPR